MAKMYPTVKEELIETDFYKKYKEEVEANKGKKCTDSEAICELIYDLVREISKVRR